MFFSPAGMLILMFIAALGVVLTLYMIQSIVEAVRKRHAPAEFGFGPQGHSPWR